MTSPLDTGLVSGTGAPGRGVAAPANESGAPGHGAAALANQNDGPGSGIPANGSADEGTETFSSHDGGPKT